MKSRRGLSAWTLAVLPFLLAPGCFLPSFERGADVDADAGAGAFGGMGGRGGADNSGGRAGSANAGEAGASEQGGSSGETSGGAAGAAGAANEVELAPREYWMNQGEELEESAEDGLLAVDRDDGWVRIAGEAPRGSDASSTRLAKYDAAFAIEADGEFRFEPVPEFFGAYEVSYVAENDEGERARGTLRVYVRPAEVEFATIADGIGGFAVTGLRDEGFGKAVAAAGDVDGDGFGDLLVGAPDADDDAGAVYVVFGGDRLRPLEIELEAEPDAGYTRIAGRESDFFGTSVAGVGDVNGDDRADFLVGAPGESLENGTAYLVYGRSRAGFGASITIDEMLASEGGRVLAGGSSENAGVLVAGGVDFTGDDGPDIVVGAQQGRARFYVVDGALDDDIELPSGAAQSFDGAGQIDTALAVATPGNVSGDGSQDLFVGTEKAIAVVRGPASAFPENLGAAFQDSDGVLLPRMVMGSVSVTAAADFDGDGELDLAYCDETLADPCLIVPNDPDGLAAGVQITALPSGPALIAGGGESSGDAFDDLVVAEPTRAYVVYGRAAPGPSIALDSLGERGFGVAGAERIAALAFGGELNRAEDDDGRGHYAEWLISNVDAASGAGRIYVVFGEPYSN